MFYQLIFLETCYIEMTSSRSPPCNHAWKGGDIYFNVNGVREHTLNHGFKDFQYCVPMDQIDKEYDQFQFESTLLSRLFQI